MPRDRRAPIVTDDHGRLDAEAVDESDDIASEIQDIVGFYRFRFVGLAVAALIGCDHEIAGRGESGDLVAIRVPGLGPSVAQHDEWAAALLDVVHAYPVGRHELMLELGHRR